MYVCYQYVHTFYYSFLIMLHCSVLCSAIQNENNTFFPAVSVCELPSSRLVTCLAKPTQKGKYLWHSQTGASWDLLN